MRGSVLSTLALRVAKLTPARLRCAGWLSDKSCHSACMQHGGEVQLTTAHAGNVVRSLIPKSTSRNKMEGFDENT